MTPDMNTSTAAALEAFRRGFTPLPIQHKAKRPHGRAWQSLRWVDEDKLVEHFEQCVAEGADGVGLLLGAPSGGLLDVDLDDPHAARLAPYFLPRTPMMTGRASSRRSHHWYRAAEGHPLLDTRRHKMPDGTVSVELRSTGTQTVIPPSSHPSGEELFWEGEPFGGERGPLSIEPGKLAAQVALLGLGAVLLSAWPGEGGRHSAYLALAGGLLRYGDGVHPFWEENIVPLIEALADETGDDDGGSSRVDETVETTIRRLTEGKKVQGFPKLGEIIGAEAADAARRMAREVEAAAGFDPDAWALDRRPQGTVTADEVNAPTPRPETGAVSDEDAEEGHEATDGEIGPENGTQPLTASSWGAVDLGPYLEGRRVTEPPTVLTREDGASLFYPGKVNMLFGPSESAKSWIMQAAVLQHIGRGERALYIDMEDDPAEVVKRLRAMGAQDEDVKDQLAYVRPEEPLAVMQRNRWGAPVESESALRAQAEFERMLAAKDPTLIVVDGMTAVYSLHGLDTNDSVGTETINRWLKHLTRGGRSCVVVIDHTTKGGGSGSAPIGSQHKTSMVSGSSIRADAVERPVPGRRGTVNLVVWKDRPGEVRRVASAGQEALVAIVGIDSREGDRTVVSFEAPQADTVAVGGPLVSAERLEQLGRLELNKASVLAVLHASPDVQVTTTDVVNATDLSRQEVYDAWQALEKDRFVLRRGERRWTRFGLTDAGKQTDPTQMWQDAQAALENDDEEDDQ